MVHLKDWWLFPEVYELHKRIFRIGFQDLWLRNMRLSSPHFDVTVHMLMKLTQEGAAEFLEWDVNRHYEWREIFGFMAHILEPEKCCYEWKLCERARIQVEIFCWCCWSLAHKWVAPFIRKNKWGIRNDFITVILKFAIAAIISTARGAICG